MAPPDGPGTAGGFANGGGGAAGGAASGGFAGGAMVDGGSVTPSWAVGTGAFFAGRPSTNPFTGDVGPSCVVFPAATKGPCHAFSFERREMSEGLLGLPTRLELLVLDPQCRPVPGAKVDVWHASPGGLYSAAPVGGVTAPQLNAGFCTMNDGTARAAGWFRAFQLTSAEGRVSFETVFPGWYPGRAWHVHFTVSVGGTESITSQLFADDALTTDVYTTHPVYAGRPPSAAGYTSNATDGAFARAGLTPSQVVMRHEKRDDGSLLMWKSITVR
jgi:protocatechuate 3,4-dioxygenase beta subunit